MQRMVQGALRGALVGVAAGILAMALAPTTRAHEAQSDAATVHADEHEYILRIAQRDERRWRAMTPQERAAQAERAEAKTETLVRKSAGPARKVGRWTKSPFGLPNYAIHAAMLPTGKILFWGYPFYDDFENRGEAALWDPAKGYGPNAFRDVDPPRVDPDGNGPQGAVPAPIYCSGQSFLPSGELLVTGGNLAWSFQDPRYESASGAQFVFTFDPWAERWTQQPSMRHGRWYPSQLELADGTTLIVGGYSDEPPGGMHNPSVEVFVPAPARGGIGTIGEYRSAARETELYPHLFTLPSGDALLAGPGPDDSSILPLSELGQGQLAWRDLPDTAGFRIGGTGVLHPGDPSGSWRVSQFGGYGTVPQREDFSKASRDALSINARAASPRWRSSSGFELGRSYHNTVLLPDRSMVTVGGGSGFSKARGNWEIDDSGKRRRVELTKPGTRRWRLGPAQREDRSYHSTALLLPDGRVWSAGDDRYPLEADGTKSRSDTAEIYSPPYLFRGRRPRLAGATTAATYNSIFYADTKPSRPRARSYVLVAPGATTHGADMQQRLVPLREERREGDTTAIRAPANSAIAPPGQYMLFGLSRKGVPSVASWISLSY